MNIIILVSKFLASWPLSFSDTFSLALILYGVVNAIKNQQWDKVEQQIEKEAFPLVSKYMTNGDKKSAVMDEVLKEIPIWFKIFMSPKDLSSKVDEVVTLKIKPKASVMGVNDNTIKDDTPPIAPTATQSLIPTADDPEGSDKMVF